METVRPKILRIEVKIKPFVGSNYIKGKGVCRTISLYRTTVEEVFSIVEKALKDTKQKGGDKN